MNIFYLSTCPIESAQMQCDKHVVKMILETAQLLSTALHSWSFEAPYKPTHKNHPSAVWARKSEQNFSWLSKHFEALCEEYTRRYNRIHKSSQHSAYFTALADYTKASTPPQCMPDDCKQPDTVQAYRQYYRIHKAYMAKWKLNNTPKWFIS